MEQSIWLGMFHIQQCSLNFFVFCLNFSQVQFPLISFNQANNLLTFSSCLHDPLHVSRQLFVFTFICLIGCNPFPSSTQILIYDDDFMNV